MLLGAMVMTEVIIRQYEQADLESCRSLWEELTQRHRDIYEDQTIGGKEPGMHFDKHLSRVGEENIWVAEHDGQVVGMVGLILEDEEEVEPIVVAFEHRNKGIGSRLLERAIEKARELGLRYLSIRPVARNSEAISLFYRTGFKSLGHIELVMDVQQEPGIKWRPGPSMFGHFLQH